MADSTYNILEVRCVVKPGATELYILIDNPTDFLPVGGWYKRAYGGNVQVLEVLGRVMDTQEFLLWDREAPDAGTQWQQDEIKALHEQIDRLCMRVAQLQMPATGQ